MPAVPDFPGASRQAGSRRHRRRRPCCSAIFTGVLLVLLLVVLGGASVVAGWQTGAVRHLLTPWRDVAVGLGRIARDSLEDRPRLTPVTSAEPLPFCAGVPPADARRLTPAFALMRGTPEGNRLYRELLTYGVCVRVTPLPYNSAYTRAVRSFNGSWAGTTITVDTGIVDSGETDVLAALLVHEATHFDRAVNGLSCGFSDACTKLKNGVELEEEVAAHAAEARWWIAAYGAGGKRFAYHADYGENALAQAYEKGPAAFTAYVRQLRGDPREGSGL